MCFYTHFPFFVGQANLLEMAFTGQLMPKKMIMPVLIIKKAKRVLYMLIITTTPQNKKLVIPQPNKFQSSQKQQQTNTEFTVAAKLEQTLGLRTNNTKQALVAGLLLVHVN